MKRIPKAISLASLFAFAYWRERVCFVHRGPARSYCLWSEAVLRLSVWGILLTPLLAQPQSAAPPLREIAFIQQSEAYPVIDREGACLAWRAPQALFAAAAEGGKGAMLGGQVLKTQVSGNGAAFVILEKMEEKQQPALRVRWFERNGEPQGAHVMPWHADHLLPQICCNATATHLLIADAALARVTVLSFDGRVLREGLLFDDPQYSNERPLFLAASTESFYVTTQILPSTAQNQVKPVLLCLNFAGQELWRQELAHSTAGGLAASDDGKWIVAGSYEVASNSAQVISSLQFFDRQGKLQLNSPGLFRQLIHSSNGERALIMDRRQVRLLRIPSGELLWQSNLASRSESFVAVAAEASLTNIFGLIATSSFKNNRFVFEKPRLVSFDFDGRPRPAATIPADLIEPALAMSRDGKQLTLAAEGQLRYFSLSLAGKAATK